MILTISIGLVFGLIGLGLLGMIISGIQSVIKGKQDIKKIVTMIVPFVVFGIAYLLMNDVTEAGLATMVFMLASMILAIFISGTRTTFNL